MSIIFGFLVYNSSQIVKISKEPLNNKLQEKQAKYSTIIAVILFLLLSNEATYKLMLSNFPNTNNYIVLIHSILFYILYYYAYNHYVWNKILKKHTSTTNLDTDSSPIDL